MILDAFLVALRFMALGSATYDVNSHISLALSIRTGIRQWLGTGCTKSRQGNNAKFSTHEGPSVEN